MLYFYHILITNLGPWSGQITLSMCVSHTFQTEIKNSHQVYLPPLELLHMQDV